MAEFEYQDGYRANIANQALETVLNIYNAVSNARLTHSDRNHIDETVKIIIAEALKESSKKKLDTTGIPF